MDSRMKVLDIYVVYENARDIKEKYCVRRWSIKAFKEPAPCEIFTKSNDYEKIKNIMENSGLLKTKRFKNDDPVIKEVWI